MCKYRLSDIQTKSAGLQIREKIIEKYGSLAAFADVIGLYENSIHQYLSSKKLGSATFKIRTTEAFGEAFNALYKDDAEQILDLASNVSLYIHDYNQLRDIEVLEKLKMMCLENELLEAYAVICRSYAHFYHNQGKTDRAMAYIDVAVKTMRDRENIDRYGLYLSDQIAMKIQEFTKKGFKKAIETFEETIEKVKGPLTRGHMYYNLGLAYFHMNAYSKSKACFEEVFKYHHDNKSVSFVYMRLGDIEKQVGNHELAIQYYKSAEKLLAEDDPTIYYVYDEYADYFYLTDLKLAETYVDRIFDDKSYRISASKHLKLYTFAKVKIALKKELEVAQVVTRVLKELPDGYIYINHHLDIIDQIIERSNLSTSTLDQLRKTIISYYQRNPDLNIEFSRKLKQLLGSVTLNLRKR